MGESILVGWGGGAKGSHSAAGGRGAGRVTKGSPSIPVGGEGGPRGGVVEGWQVGCVQSTQRGDK